MPTPSPNPRSHHIDKRAAGIAESGSGDPDDLIDTRALAAWLGLSREWLEIGRSRGYGPNFIRLTPRRLRYRRADVLKWLEERTVAAEGRLLNQINKETKNEDDCEV